MEAHTALRKGDYAASYDAYQKAFALKPSFDIAANLGNLELELGKSCDAAFHLRYALAHFPPSASAAAREKIKRRLSEAQGEVATLQIAIAEGGSGVWIDGHELRADDTLSEIFVEPGTHTVEARKAGFATTRVQVEAKPATVHHVQLVLQPLPPLRTVANDVSPMDASKSATVGVPALASRHASPLSPRQAKGSGAVEVESGSTKRPSPALAQAEVPPPRGRSSMGGAGPSSLVPVLVLGGVAALGVTVGTAATILAHQNENAIERDRDSYPHCPDPVSCSKLKSTVHENEKRRDTDRIVATLSFVGGGAAAAGALAYWLWPRHDRGPNPSTSRLLPHLSASPRHIELGWTWRY